MLCLTLPDRKINNWKTKKEKQKKGGGEGKGGRGREEQRDSSLRENQKSQICVLILFPNFIYEDKFCHEFGFPLISHLYSICSGSNL